MAINTRYLDLQLMKFDLFKEQNPEDGRFDVIFEVEEKLLYAHKPMLTLVSDTFSSMLSDPWNPNKDAPIKIKDYSYGNFYQFLVFLYSGECQLTDSNIFSMVDIAEFYGVQLFKTYCDEYLSSMEITPENIFKLIELTNKYSMVQLKASTLGYITKNFQSFGDSDGFLGAERSFVEEIFTFGVDEIKPDDLFQAVYKWAEKHAMNKQAANPTLNLNDQIKAEMSDFLPKFCFDKMELKFLLEFVLQRGFIFTSFNQLSKTLCDRILPHKVKITNGLGQTLHGELKCDNVFIDVIKALKSSNSGFGTEKSSWWKCKNIGSNQSPLKKREGVEWYLIYYPGEFTRYIGYTHHSESYANGCVLAEMFTSENSNFKATAGSKIEIE